MKKQIYITLSILIVVLGVMLVAFYYTQDFEANWNFKSVVSVDDIHAVYYNDYDEFSRIRSAWVNVGTLNMVNNGYFEQKYEVPVLTACLIQSDGTTSSLQIGFDSYSNDLTYSLNDFLEVPVGGNSSHDIFVSSYSYSLDNLGIDDLEQIEIYDSEPDRPASIFDTTYRSSSCSILHGGQEPFATILIQ